MRELRTIQSKIKRFSKVERGELDRKIMRKRNKE